jgi:hypothetical protein
MQIYNAQRQFYQEQVDNKSWVRNFKNKTFFTEAFILYKISVRANDDDKGIQRALFWEIGLKKKIKFAIRKIVNKSIEDMSGGGGYRYPEGHQNPHQSHSHGQQSHGGQHQHRRRFSRKTDTRQDER